MATVPAHYFYTDDAKLFSSRASALTAGSVRLFRQGCDALAEAIDVLLTAVHVLAALALAISLIAVAAGLALPPPY